MEKHAASKGRKRKARGPGRPVTTGTGTFVGCRCHKAFLTALDRWRKSRDLSRPAAIVQLADSQLAAEAKKP